REGLYTVSTSFELSRPSTERKRSADGIETLLVSKNHPMKSRALVIFLWGCEFLGCGGDDDAHLTREELVDPETCKTCHADHFAEWAGSMHAYASDDPIFIAMNARGQRETNGALGDFCVKCHAPMAVHESATTDGKNLGD